MSRGAIFFLVIVTLGLTVLLAWLGWMTIPFNLLGWFLFITGWIYFGGILVVYWIRGIRFWRALAAGKIEIEERGDRSFWFIIPGMMAVFYLPPLEYLFSPGAHPPSIWIQITGLSIVFFGSALFVWARSVLGDFYSGHVSVIEGQPLVRHGPYRFIRHPAYAGYLLIAMGLAIGYASLAGSIAVALLLIPSVVYRIHVEDKLLAKSFGAQFTDYARRTKRLLPHLW